MSLMDPDFDQETDNTWGKSWEDQVFEEYANERDVLDQQSKLEQETGSQNLWVSFQSSATAVTNLYKDCLQEENCWLPFQSTAGAVTTLYKDGVDAQKKAFEHGLQLGYNKKARELITWIKKKQRRHIRRDDMIAFVCGKAPPVKTQRHSPPRSRLASRSHSERGPNLSPAPKEDIEPDLTPFQNALAIQGLNGAMSSVSMAYSPSTKTRSDELNCFIMDGLSRHNESRKRSKDSHDLTIDSPNRKRSRLL